MIFRIWRGRVPLSRAAEYRTYQHEVGPPGYRVVPGNRAIYMVGRDLGAEYEIAMLTAWESWDAIRDFAGVPVDRARYYERDFDFLIDPPERVEHFDVLAAENLARGVDGRVARLWKGLAASSRREEAAKLEADVAIPGYRRVPGNRGIYVLGRDVPRGYELGLLTLWDSRGSIRQFAGDPIDRAFYDDYRRRGMDHLIEMPETVEIFDVLSAEHPG